MPHHSATYPLGILAVRSPVPEGIFAIMGRQLAKNESATEGSEC